MTNSKNGKDGGNNCNSFVFRGAAAAVGLVLIDLQGGVRPIQLDTGFADTCLHSGLRERIKANLRIRAGYWSVERSVRERVIAGCEDQRRGQKI